MGKSESSHFWLILDKARTTTSRDVSRTSWSIPATTTAYVLLTKFFSFIFVFKRAVMAFEYLVRFVAGDGNTYYGDAIISNGSKDLAHTIRAKVIEGDIYGSYTVTDKVVVS